MLQWLHFHLCAQQTALVSTRLAAAALAWPFLLVPVDHGGRVGAVQVLAVARGQSTAPSPERVQVRQRQTADAMRGGQGGHAGGGRQACQLSARCTHILPTAVSTSVPLAAARAAALAHL